MTEMNYSYDLGILTLHDSNIINLDKENIE